MKNKLNIILYYIGVFISAIAFYLAFQSNITFYSINSELFITLLIINAISVIVFTVLLFIKKLNNLKIIIQIIYILFCIIMILISYGFSTKRILGALSMPYYATLILIGFTILNIYSLLSFETKKPIEK